MIANFRYRDSPLEIYVKENTPQYDGVFSILRQEFR